MSLIDRVEAARKAFNRNPTDYQLGYEFRCLYQELCDRDES